MADLSQLKCDEKHPECLQCSRKNVACPGYKSKSLVWSTKHEKLRGPATGSPATQSTQTAMESPPSPRRENSCRAASSERVDSEIEDMAPGSTPVTSDVLMNLRQNAVPNVDSLAAIRQQLHQSSVPEFLIHLPTMLVDYYFNYVCQIFSSFDGTLNPFRSTIGRLWDGSAPIYYAIQSMAAAYLSNHFPRMSTIGIQMQRDTYRYLYEVKRGGFSDPGNLDKTLLTILLVGQTTAWHNPTDLGLVHLKSAKRINRRRLEQQTSQQLVRSARRQNEFFEQCILYWDMLAGFVDDDVDESFEIPNLNPETLGDSSNSSCQVAQVFPHPWTGVAPRILQLFAQVGRLIRRYRKFVAEDAASINMLSLDLGFDVHYPQNSFATLESISKAQSLEEELLEITPPLIRELVDAGDENTPVQHYLDLAEAYRNAALLQIYRIFPTILLKRVPLTGNNFGTISTSALGGENPFSFLPDPSQQSPDDFLVSLAMHTISLLENLPSNSGTRCLQPILHIVAASELRFSPPSIIDPLSPFTPTSSISYSLTNREVDIAAARRFVVTRLQGFQLSLPAKPIVKALELIQETWARADLGQDVYWMDVMEQMGWASIFG